MSTKTTRDNMIEKHLYKRKNGKKEVTWYFWFYDENGKRVRRSCGCKTKRDAQAFVSMLKDEDLIPLKSKTLNSLCSGMYERDSLFLKRMAARGSVIVEHTRTSKLGYLNKILDEFGERNVKDLRPYDYDAWLLDLELSNSSKNNIITVLKEMYKDLYYRGEIDVVPNFESFATTDTKEKGILSLQEIQYLFPDEHERLIHIWRLYKHQSEYDIFQFATVILLLLTTGLRSGEVRALQNHQRIRRDALLINAMMDSENKRVDHLKKGSDKNKRWRIAIIPEKTIRMLDKLETYVERSAKVTPHIFEFNKKPFQTYYLINSFRKILNKNGIDAKNRNITIHSCRFTYNSIMRREITDSDLRLMLGHTTESMTDYYDKKPVLENLPKLLENKKVIDNIFSDKILRLGK